MEQIEIVNQMMIGQVIANGAVIDFLHRKGLISLPEISDHLAATARNWESAGPATVLPIQSLADLLNRITHRDPTPEGEPPQGVPELSSEAMRQSWVIHEGGRSQDPE